ncbi:gpW family head-tail joining protein [Fulvimarina manganoxydans]|uniref:gpW family head-tail joining protein n=1 Tax=Fulvimarina manganoxydans TaxID=937218 RepID=UPI000A04617E|nr:gpW family head-tail joining protein [Fulvimarina manganoxydans]
MGQPLDGVDLDDPCALLKALKAARLRLATGALTVSVKSGDEEVSFSKADPTRLDRAIAEAERACHIASGQAPQRRRFLTAGFLR